MSEWWRGGGLKTADPWRGIRRFPPVEGPSVEGIEGKRKVTHSHLLTAVWSSSLNHKQVSLLLFFHPARSSSPPSASLWGSEAWETGSKHRSYDSAWPRIRGTGGDTVCLSNNLSSTSAYTLKNVLSCSHAHSYLSTEPKALWLFQTNITPSAPLLWLSCMALWDSFSCSSRALYCHRGPDGQWVIS